ncbi:Aste57867_8487 [Aphanomyces stellatus]|uniref:Aste57867_8487 protein n=1 Tax=Aphanomyces stellatus TaxID=120398 RepID=A0A485KKF1_9STRA|nr:hypothetical protein As57867_008455 [Aphanomyces stellatus]VFT85373.1 Aste57867_8487 [Aphanomyces stellatus]
MPATTNCFGVVFSSSNRQHSSPLKRTLSLCSAVAARNVQVVEPFIEFLRSLLVGDWLCNYRVEAVSINRIFFGRGSTTSPLAVVASTNSVAQSTVQPHMTSNSPWLQNSDFVTRFKNIHDQTSEAATGVALPPEPHLAPPDAVVKRLGMLGLTWGDLPPLAKQAIIWDSGFVVGNVHGVDRWLRVYVASGSMVNIMMPKAAFKNTLTVSQTIDCPSPITGTMYARQQRAVFAQTNQLVQCAVENTQNLTAYSHSSVWAQDALAIGDIPVPRVFMHTYHANAERYGPSIHGLPQGSTTETIVYDSDPTKHCQARGVSSGMIIPCGTKGWNASENDNMHEPAYSATMNGWLVEIKAAKQSNASPKTALIFGLTVGGVVVLFVLFLLVYRRQSKTGYGGIQTPTGDFADGPAAAKLEPLQICRLDEQNLVLSTKLGSGAFADVYRGTYRGQLIAAKKLQANRLTSNQLMAFVGEIQLLASFNSPYIVKLVGAAWTCATDLTCIMELMDGGDLKDLLDTTTASTYLWTTKYMDIYSILQGLSYLHALNIIHRDVKSRNILLDSSKDAKLTDFGISKEDIQVTMTMGVGTFRWMAPEVIQDQAYTVAADIYSFGCVLAEFDTHHVPYHDMKNPVNGQPIADSAIMVKVVTGALQPTLSPECPEWIRDIARQCLATLPDSRPSASELANIVRLHLRELSSELFSV